MPANESPLPDRIRPLEGAGLYNMMSDAESHGFASRPRGLPIVPSLCGAFLVAAFLSWLAFFS